MNFTRLLRGNRLLSKHSFWEQSLDIEDALIANQSSFSILIFLFFSLFPPFNEQDRICCNNKWATLVRSKQKPPKNSRSSTSSVEFDAKTFFFLEKARTRDLRIQRRDKANFSPTLRNSVGNCGKLVHVWSLMTSSSLVWQLCAAMMCWVGYLLKDSELFILFAENSQILLKISVIPILVTFIYLVELNLLLNNQLNSSLRHILVTLLSSWNSSQPCSTWADNFHTLKYIDLWYPIWKSNPEQTRRTTCSLYADYKSFELFLFQGERSTVTQKLAERKNQGIYNAIFNPRSCSQSQQNRIERSLKVAKKAFAWVKSSKS